MTGDAMAWIAAVSDFWGSIKTSIEQTFGSHNDIYHVIAGLSVQGLAMLALRQSPQRIWPWLAVLVLELLNEWHDLYVEVWPTRQIQIGEGLKDIILTMALPTAILLATRRFPYFFGLKPLKRKARFRSGRPY